MSLEKFKMKNLNDKIREQEVVEDTEVSTEEVDVSVKKVNKVRRLNK